jgi:IclR family transcriptional regulator, acetate operon repressor
MVRTVLLFGAAFKGIVVLVVPGYGADWRDILKSTTEDDRGGIQSIARAASVLRALGQRQQGMSLGEIAQVVGLPRSTVQRLVQALQQERLVEVGGVAGSGVRLGPALGELAGTIRVDVVRVARPHLQVLFDTLHETVDIAQARGGEVQFLDQIVSDRELRAVSRKDARLSLHWLACGKALLAAMSDAGVASVLGPTLVPATGRSITSLPALLAELADVRRTGFAYDREELSEGVCAIAAGITAARGRHYAVSVVVPAQRFEPALPAIRAALAVCKAGIETDLLAAMGPGG